MVLLNTQPKEKKEENNKETKVSIWRYIFDFAKLIVFALVIVWLIHQFVLQPFVVFGPSMEPNFYDKDYLIVEKVSYYFRSPKRGEVVIFSPEEKDNFLIKRVIGLPNERVVIKNGDIFIYNEDYPQGIKLQESDYLPSIYSTPGDIDCSLKDNEYFLLGDNRHISLDSRSFGPIPEEQIVGRPVFRGYPLKAFGAIEKVEYSF